jgi:hypothetical protein
MRVTFLIVTQRYIPQSILIMLPVRALALSEATKAATSLNSSSVGSRLSMVVLAKSASAASLVMPRPEAYFRNDSCRVSDWGRALGCKIITRTPSWPTSAANVKATDSKAATAAPKPEASGVPAAGGCTVKDDAGALLGHPASRCSAGHKDRLRPVRYGVEEIFERQTYQRYPLHLFKSNGVEGYVDSSAISGQLVKVLFDSRFVQSIDRRRRRFMARGLDLLGDLLHRGHGVTGHMNAGAFGRERARYGATNRAAGTVYDSCFTFQLLCH